MKRKLKLPILLMAVVVMLSIFYIKEAEKNNNSTPVNSELETSVLNPEFTEARIERIENVNAQIEELEELIAGGTLSAEKVLETTTMIDEIKEIKRLETNLEEVIMDQMEYDDVLVIMSDLEVVVDIYTDVEPDTITKIEILKLATECFSDKAQEYSVVVSNSLE